MPSPALRSKLASALRLASQASQRSSRPSQLQHVEGVQERLWRCPVSQCEAKRIEVRHNRCRLQRTGAQYIAQEALCLGSRTAICGYAHRQRVEEMFR